MVIIMRSRRKQNPISQTVPESSQSNKQTEEEEEKDKEYQSEEKKRGKYDINNIAQK